MQIFGNNNNRDRVLNCCESKQNLLALTYASILSLGMSLRKLSTIEIIIPKN